MRALRRHGRKTCLVVSCVDQNLIDDLEEPRYVLDISDEETSMPLKGAES